MNLIINFIAIFCFMSVNAQTLPDNLGSPSEKKQNEQVLDIPPSIETAEASSAKSETGELVTENAIEPTETNKNQETEPKEAETTKDTINICNQFTEETDKLQCLEIIAQITMNKAATEMCNHFPPSNARLQCLNIIAGKGVDDPVKEFCTSFDRVENKIECLSIMSEKTFDVNIVSTCNKFIEPSNKLQCLNTMGDKTISPQVIDICQKAHNEAPDKTLKCLTQYLDVEFDSIGPELCDRFMLTSFKLQCLDIIANKTLNHVALSICEQNRHLVTKEQVLACFSQVTEKTFNPEKLNTCKEQETKEKKWQCLQQLMILSNAESTNLTNPSPSSNQKIKPLPSPKSNTKKAPQTILKFQPRLPKQKVTKTQEQVLGI